MTHLIIHHEGAYNVWSTVADAPIYGCAMNLAQLLSAPEVRRNGLPLPSRMDRAHATGSSGFCDSLDACIAVNRAGPGESKLSRDEFIAKYLTLPSNKEQA